MTRAPVLSTPDFNIPFVLETDASAVAIRAVLIQQQHHIAYYSKVLCPRLRRASAYVRELHAITSAVRKWRHYLLGTSFTILTDHKSLKDLMSQVIQTPKQQTYLVKLLGYDYEIRYKPGVSNVVADALSRLPSGEFLSFTVPHFDFLDTFRRSLTADNQYCDLLTAIQTRPADHPSLSVHRGLIFKDHRIWLPFPTPFTSSLLEEFHTSPLGDHSGVAKTLHRLQQSFDWPNIRADVRHFISHCLICQQTKYETKKPSGLLQPLPISARIWEDLSLDFITGLPPSHSHTVILVVVDRYSKGAHFGAFPAQHTAHQVAVRFMDMVCKHHGFPRSLVSDMDALFLSHFWRELFRLNGTQLRMSTAYHPQSDGQTEVVNCTLEQYLRAYVHHKPNQWFRYLSLAEWSYNTTVHSSTGFTPFEIIYGRPPPNIVDYVMGSSPIDAVDSFLTDRTELHVVLQRRLLKAQFVMKVNDDKHRHDVHYVVGDWVFLRLRPYRQKSMTPTYSKLAKRFFGPYQVTERIGPVAYKLALPTDSRIHNVFHVSLLKAHHGPPPSNDNPLPSLAVDHHPVVKPLTILDWKWDLSVTPPQRMVLVQWMGLPPEDTS